MRVETSKPTPADPRAAAEALGEALRDARALARELEAGQAQTPLLDRLDALVADADREPLRVLGLRVDAAPGEGGSGVVKFGGAVLRTLSVAGPADLRALDREWRAPHLVVVESDRPLDGDLSEAMGQSLAGAVAWTTLVGSSATGSVPVLAPPAGVVALTPRQGSSSSSILGPLARKDGGLATALRLASVARRVREMASYLGERQGEELQRLTSWHQSTVRAGRFVAVERNEDEPRLARLRAQVQSEAGRLARTLVERADELRRSPIELVGEARDLVESLDGDDLERQRLAKSWKLTLSEHFVAALEDALRDALAKEWTESYGRVMDAQRALTSQVQRELAECGHDVRPDPRPADEEPMLSHLDAVAIDPRFRGDLPRRGLFQRLSHARRPVFMVMMMTMLFGGLFGFSRRSPVLSSVLIVLFFGGLVYTFVDWRKEDADRIGKEIERLRERLLDLVRSAVGDFAREQTTRLERHSGEVQGELMAAIDSAVRGDVAERRTRSSHQDRERAYLLKSLESRLQHARAAGQLGAAADQSSGAAIEAARALLTQQGEEESV